MRVWPVFGKVPRGMEFPRHFQYNPPGHTTEAQDKTGKKYESGSSEYLKNRNEIKSFET